MKRVPLGKVADVNWGDTSVTKASYVESGFPAYSATGADGFLPYHDYDREAIVLSAIGARCGKTWFATGKWSAIKNTIRFWSETPDLDNRYLYWLTANQDFWPRRGAAQPFITIGDARNIEIPLPPFEEQKRIAAILDQADEVRRLRQRTIDRLSQLGQSIFYEIFGDISQLSRTHSFDEIALIQQSLVDPKLPQYRSQLHVGPEHIASNAGVVNWEGVRTAQEDNLISGKNRFQQGDILYSKIRPYLNKVALADRSGICSADMYVIQPIEQKATAHFLRMLLMGRDFLAYAETCSNRANIPKLNRKQVEGYRFYCPPIDAQREFADRLANLVLMCSDYAKAAEASSNLFASLQHRAFRGEL